MQVDFSSPMADKSNNREGKQVVKAFAPTPPLPTAVKTKERTTIDLLAISIVARREGIGLIDRQTVCRHSATHRLH